MDYDKRAAASRLASLVNRYPLYSKADRALWMLGNIWEGTEKKELAAPYYARIVREYPLSPLVPQAKDKLKELKAPVPQADPKAVAWMTAEKNAPRKHDAMLLKPLALVHTNPREELYAASKTGEPTMTPESDSDAGVDILSGGNQSRIGGGPGNSIVANVTPGEPGGTAGTTSGAESVAPPADGTEAKPDAQKPDPAATDPANGATAAGASETAQKTDGTAEAAGTNGTAKDDGGAAAPGQASDAANANAAASKNDTKDSKKESSSKKKKGLKKIIPW